MERLDKYLELVLKGLKTGLFSYVAHPDIIRFTGDDKAYEERIRSFIREVVKLGYPLELNRLGFFEKRHYPRDLFWKIAGEEGATAVIGLDAHTPEVYLDRETVKKIEAYLEEHHVKRILPQMIRFNREQGSEDLHFTAFFCTMINQDSVKPCPYQSKICN